jgi:hypothetical protein
MSLINIIALSLGSLVSWLSRLQNNQNPLFFYCSKTSVSVPNLLVNTKTNTRVWHFTMYRTLYGDLKMHHFWNFGVCK